jgi:uncharacterized membrane protein YgcG
MGMFLKIPYAVRRCFCAAFLFLNSLILITPPDAMAVKSILYLPDAANSHVIDQAGLLSHQDFNWIRNRFTAIAQANKAQVHLVIVPEASQPLSQTAATILNRWRLSSGNHATSDILIVADAQGLKHGTQAARSVYLYFSPELKTALSRSSLVEGLLNPSASGNNHSASLRALSDKLADTIHALRPTPSSAFHSGHSPSQADDSPLWILWTPVLVSVGLCALVALGSWLWRLAHPAVPALAPAFLARHHTYKCYELLKPTSRHYPHGRYHLRQ